MISQSTVFKITDSSFDWISIVIGDDVLTIVGVKGKKHCLVSNFFDIDEEILLIVIVRLISLSVQIFGRIGRILCPLELWRIISSVNEIDDGISIEWMNMNEIECSLWFFVCTGQ